MPLVHSIPWYIALVESVPEAFLCLLLGFKVYNVQVSAKNLFIISLFNAVFTYFLRELPILYGLHTVIILIVLTVLTTVIYRVPLLKSFICVLTGILILGIIQFLTLPMLFNIFGVDLSITEVNPWWNFILFIPSGVIMLLMYVINKKFNLVLYDLG